MIALLPLLYAGTTATTTPKVVVTGSHEIVERALNQNLRERLDAGWSIADMHEEADEYDIFVIKGTATERHFVHYVGSTETYTVSTEKALPLAITAPDAATLTALANPRGGLSLSMGCGGYSTLTYIVSDAQTGEAAGTLVARTLATATDLFVEQVTDSHAIIDTVRKDGHFQVHVWLDKGKVIEAEVRAMAWGGDGRYTRIPQLHTAMKRTRVISISASAGWQIVTTKGGFTIDPNGDAFPREPDDGGCGC